jgi:hypothetical protein
MAVGSDPKEQLNPVHLFAMKDILMKIYNEISTVEISWWPRVFHKIS